MYCFNCGHKLIEVSNEGGSWKCYTCSQCGKHFVNFPLIGNTNSFENQAGCFS